MIGHLVHKITYLSTIVSVVVSALLSLGLLRLAAEPPRRRGRGACLTERPPRHLPRPPGGPHAPSPRVLFGGYDDEVSHKVKNYRSLSTIVSVTVHRKRIDPTNSSSFVASGTRLSDKRTHVPFVEDASLSTKPPFPAS